MSSLRNAVSRRAHKERAQPEARKKFGILEKHKDYVERAKVFHKKEDTIRRLKEKAAFRNPEEFNFKMINSRTVNGVHRSKGQGSKYTADELSLMKTQDMGYVLQKLQSEKKKIEKLSVLLHLLDHPPSNTHVYFAENRKEARKLESRLSNDRSKTLSAHIPAEIKKKTAASYKELDDRRKRAKDLEKVYNEMSLQKELQKKGRKRKLREDELVNPTSGPVYKWHTERKR